MALIQLGGGITDIRGSIGGNTFAKSMAGNYVRAWKKPTNPNSPQQVARRATLSYVATYWSTQLDDAQRLAWRDYAAATTWKNRLGQVIKMTGLSAFVKSAAHLHPLGVDMPDDAPETPGRPGGQTIVATASATDNKITITEPVTPYVNAEDGHLLVFFSTLAYPAGRDGTPRAFRFLGFAQGSEAGPPEWPKVVTSKFNLSETNKIWIRTIYLDPEHRVSAATFRDVTIAA